MTFLLPNQQCQTAVHGRKILGHPNDYFRTSVNASLALAPYASAAKSKNPGYTTEYTTQVRAMLPMEWFIAC